MNYLSILVKVKYGSVAKFAEGMGVSVPTATRWLKNPDTMTIKQVKELARITNIRVDDMLRVAANLALSSSTLLSKAYEH